MIDFSHKENSMLQGNSSIQWEIEDSIDCNSSKEKFNEGSCSKQQKVAKKIYKWLAHLSAEERQLVLTDTCPEFTQLLLSLLKSHETKEHSLLSVIPLEGNESCSKELKVVSLGILEESARSSPVHESLLLSEVRLFTKEIPLDSITVSHKLVGDAEFLIDCFRYVSKEQCFQFPCTNKTPTKSKGRKKVKQCDSVIQSFPSWFSNNIGYTIYQWIEAFFEYLIMKRYQIMNIEGESALFERYMSSIKKLFEEHNNLVNFWERADRSKLVQEIYKNLVVKDHKEESMKYIKFLLYAGINASPLKFIDSLFFSPLNGNCTFKI